MHISEKLRYTYLRSDQREPFEKEASLQDLMRAGGKVLGGVKNFFRGGTGPLRVSPAEAANLEKLKGVASPRSLRAQGAPRMTPTEAMRLESLRNAPSASFSNAETKVLKNPLTSGRSQPPPSNPFEPMPTRFRRAATSDGATQILASPKGSRVGVSDRGISLSPQQVERVNSLPSEHTVIRKSPALSDFASERTSVMGSPLAGRVQQRSVDFASPARLNIPSDRRQKLQEFWGGNAARSASNRSSSNMGAIRNRMEAAGKLPIAGTPAYGGSSDLRSLYEQMQKRGMRKFAHVRSLLRSLPRRTTYV